MKLLRYNDAKKEIEKCLELDPNNIKAMLRFGQIYYN